MKKGILVSLFLVFCICLFSGCAKTESEKETKSETNPKYVSAKDLNESQIIDIRTPDRYIGWKNEKGVSGHIDGAIDFPVSWLEYDKDMDHINIELKRRNIDKSRKTVLYSDDEVSKEEYEKFINLGFKDLFLLKGGINEYSKSVDKFPKLQGYERYVSPDWVEKLLEGKKPEGYKDEKYVIVEVSLPSEKDEYANGHIKGAVNINSDIINHIPGPRTVQEYDGIPIDKQLKFWGFPSDSDIKNTLESLGIDNNTMVILYATEKATTAANRTALVMDYAGVKNIKLLNGGKKLWNLENRSLDKNNVVAKKVDFGVSVPQKPQIIFDYKKELELVNNKNAAIASVRSFDEYLCKKSGYTYIEKAGDIKNSRFAYAGSNPYAMEDFRNLDNTMFNYDIISKRWKKWGINKDKIVSFHCGTGWRASETYYIADALGWKNIGVYVGGWYEWTKRDEKQVKEPGLPKDAPEKKPEEFFYK